MGQRKTSVPLPERREHSCDRPFEDSLLGNIDNLATAALPPEAASGKSNNNDDCFSLRSGHRPPDQLCAKSAHKRSFWYPSYSPSFAQFLDVLAREMARSLYWQAARRGRFEGLRPERDEPRQCARPSPSSTFVCAGCEPASYGWIGNSGNGAARLR